MADESMVEAYMSDDPADKDSGGEGLLDAATDILGAVDDDLSATFVSARCAAYFSTESAYEPAVNEVARGFVDEAAVDPADRCRGGTLKWAGDATI